jgi:hypothetical protein
MKRKHIRSANELKTEDDAEMLERMITLSEQVATNIDNVSKTRLCFHIPPFNSIDHIHLHVLCSPETLNNYLLPILNLYFNFGITCLLSASSGCRGS